MKKRYEDECTPSPDASRFWPGKKDTRLEMVGEMWFLGGVILEQEGKEGRRNRRTTEGTTGYSIPFLWAPP